MSINNTTHGAVVRIVEELFDQHIENALRSVLPFTRNEPGPWQLSVANTRVPIGRISAAVRREIALLFDGDAMRHEVELMIRASGI